MDKTTILTTVEKLLNKPDQTFILSTLTSDGYPDSRLMGNICEKSIEEVYFTCQTGSRKTIEIAQNAKCSVYFTCDTVTVWLYGEATVTTDADVRKKIWNDRMLRIYSAGVDSPNLTVIRFVPAKLRYREQMSGYIELDL